MSGPAAVEIGITNGTSKVSQILIPGPSCTLAMCYSTYQICKGYVLVLQAPLRLICVRCVVWLLLDLVFLMFFWYSFCMISIHFWCQICTSDWYARDAWFGNKLQQWSSRGWRPVCKWANHLLIDFVHIFLFICFFFYLFYFLFLKLQQWRLDGDQFANG